MSLCNSCKCIFANAVRTAPLRELFSNNRIAKQQANFYIPLYSIDQRLRTLRLTKTTSFIRFPGGGTQV